jgi:hypothetical protein
MPDADPTAPAIVRCPVCGMRNHAYGVWGDARTWCCEGRVNGYLLLTANGGLSEAQYVSLLRRALWHGLPPEWLQPPA